MQGKTCQSFYLINAGKLTIRRQGNSGEEKDIASRHPGDMVGEMSFLTGRFLRLLLLVVLGCGAGYWSLCCGVVVGRFAVWSLLCRAGDLPGVSVLSAESTEVSVLTQQLVALFFQPATRHLHLRATIFPHPHPRH